MMPESDAPSLASELSDRASALGRPRRRWWQISMRTAFLIMAAIGVWMAYFANRRQNALVQSRIDTLVPLAHELVVDDPAKIAVVYMEEYWFSDDRWEIYLPEGKYRLSLATRGIDAGGGFPATAKGTEIAAGGHIIAFEQREQEGGWRIVALCDGKDVLAVDETKEWEGKSGANSAGQGSPSEQLAPEKPVVFKRMNFMRPYDYSKATSREAAPEGVLLWLERVSTPGAKR
jgi:hypothetical protein